MHDARGPRGVGIVGCGYWGVNYVRVFNESSESHTAGVCDLQADRLESVRRRFPAVFVTTQLDDLLKQEGINAIVVSTEARSHYQVVLRCLNAGKHVLVEKPLTTNSKEAEELTRVAESKRLILMVGHTFLFNAGVIKLKEYVSKAPEQVYYMHAKRTNLGPVRRDVNALWDLASHDISIMNYLLESTPKWVSAVAARVLKNGREDIGFISLGYPDGVLGHIHASWADPNKAREVVVVCSDKRIVFDDLNGQEQVRVFEKGIRPVPTEPSGYGEFRLQIRDGDILSPKIEITEPLKEECRHFMECVQSGQRPLTSGHEGAEVVRVLEAIDRSVELGGMKVEVEAYGNRVQTAARSAVR